MADYQELISVELDQDEWQSSLSSAAQEYEDFIARLNDAGDDLKLAAPDTSAVSAALNDVASQISSLADLFRTAFGAGADAAVASADAATSAIKARVEEASQAAVASEHDQTEAIVAESEKRTEARTKEAREWAAIQKELKSDDSVRDARRFDSASMSARQSLEQELQSASKAKERLEQQQVASEERRQRRLKNAPLQLSDEERFDEASSSARQSLEQELQNLSVQRESERSRAAKDAEKDSGGGFLAEIGGGITGLAEFYGELMLVMAAFQAITAIVKAPFQAIADGVKVTAEWEEKASQLKANLLDSGVFSKDPAQNLRDAGVAADALYQKLLQLSAQLNVTPDKLQAAFAMFNSRGGGNLTHNLSESADVSGYVTAALQSQNPLIQQRQVATQIQKLVAGTLKDSDKLPAAFGLSAEALNRMSVEARTSHNLLQQIEAAAPGLSDRFTESGNRLDSVVQKLTLMKDQLEGTLAAPLFAVLVSAAKQLGDWIERNRGDLQTLLSEFGGMIGGIASEFLQLGHTIGLALSSPLKFFLQELGAALATVQILTASVDMAANLPKALAGDKSARSSINTDQESIRDANEQQKRLHESLHDSPQQARDAQLQRARERANSEYPDDPNADHHLRENAKANRDSYYAKQRQEIMDSYQERADPQGWLDSQVQSAIGNYQPKPIPPTEEAISAQTSKLRESYQQEIKKITSAGTEFRKQVDQDVKAGIATLEQATAEKATSFDNQAKEVEAAGQRYTSALRSVRGKGSNSPEQSLADTISSNDRKAGDDATNGKRADQLVIQQLNQELEQAKEKTAAALAEGTSHHSLSIAERMEQRGVLTPEQLEREKFTAQDHSDSANLESLQKQLADIRGNDSDSVKRRAELQGQIDQHQQQQQFLRSDYSRSSAEDSFNERQRRAQMGVNADQQRIAELEAKERQHEVEGEHPDDLRSDKNDVLNARLLSNNDQIKMLSDALDHLTEAIKAAPENASNPSAAVVASPKVQDLQLKIASLGVDNATIRDLQVQNASRTGFGNKSADKLFGKVDTDTGAHFDTWEHSAQSVSNLTSNVGQGISAVEGGYQQGGVGGAVGAGLSQIGQFIPGVGGAVLGAIGGITSLLSGLFTQAAQEIGKEVAKAVDQVMEKYSTGQLSLNQTIIEVQQQMNNLIAQESGRKGGQGVLDNELPQLQQELDSLKYQQQQTSWNFQDSTVEASSTNSVVEQWLTDWININKQVYQYQQAVGSAGDAQIAQYLNEEMQQQQVSLESQYNQGQQQAINDALQLNNLLQQRNNYEDQYRQQQFQILSADSLQRRGNPAEESARQLSMAKSQYDQETQQMDYEIAQYQQKVSYEQQIFNLASDTATLQEQSLEAQSYQLQQQMAQYQAIVQLLAETNGAVYSNGSWNIPGVGTSSGGGFVIPGTTQTTTNTDNSVNGQTVTINLSVPPGTSGSTLANDIAEALAYVNRTRS